MRSLSNFQKQLVDELVKQGAIDKISLDAVLLKFLPEDLFIGKSDFNDFCVWYREDKLAFVHGELSFKILEFLKLIAILVKLDYLTRVERCMKPTKEQVSIGMKVTDNKYTWVRFGTNLNYFDIESFF